MQHNFITQTLKISGSIRQFCWYSHHECRIWWETANCVCCRECHQYWQCWWFQWHKQITSYCCWVGTSGSCKCTFYPSSRWKEHTSSFGGFLYILRTTLKLLYHKVQPNCGCASRSIRGLSTRQLICKRFGCVCCAVLSFLLLQLLLSEQKLQLLPSNQICFSAVVELPWSTCAWSSSL